MAAGFARSPHFCEVGSPRDGETNAKARWGLRAEPAGPCEDLTGHGSVYSSAHRSALRRSLLGRAVPLSTSARHGRSPLSAAA